MAALGVASTACDAISFDERITCPACGDLSSTSLWSGRFSDGDVSRWLARFHYDADLAAALGDQPFDLRRCSSCGQAYHRFVPSAASVPAIYGRWISQDQVSRFEEEHTTKADGFRTGVQLVKLVLRLRHLALRARPGLGAIRLLDFGCGNGELLRAAHLLGMVATGIDVSDNRRSEAGGDGIAVHRDLAGYDAREPEPANVVALNQVLEHVTAPLDLLRALRARMAPGGILFVGVPDCTGIAKPADFRAFHAVQPIEHVNAFTPDTLRAMVCRAGFEPQKAPAAFVTTRPASAARTAAGLLYRPSGTDQFFQRT